MPPLRQKKYHQRGAWACDECRLRKRKCDGAQPCSLCVAISRVCTYDSKTPLQPPTQRIRLLEAKLRQARSVLQQLKSKRVNAKDVDIDTALEELQVESSPTNDFQIQEREVEDKEEKVNNMMGGYGRLIPRPGNSESFFGNASGFSFVCRTLEMFLRDLEIIPSTSNVQSALLDLFDAPMPEKWRMNPTSKPSAELPGRTMTLQLINTLFLKCPLIAQLFHEAELREVVDHVYHQKSGHFEEHVGRYWVLIHAVLAIGYLYYTPIHRMEGCQAANIRALRHFFTARQAVDISQCNNIVSLQTILCIIIFLVSTSRLASAHSFIGVACSSGLRLGLYNDLSNNSSISFQNRQARLRILVTIIKLDIYSSIILGLPPFVGYSNPNNGLDFNSIPKINLELREDTSRDDTMSLNLSIQNLKLLRITAVGLQSVFPQGLLTTSALNNSDETFPVNRKQLEMLEDQFQAWARGFSSLVQFTADSPRCNIAKYELEMTYNFGRIVIYQPFLHYLRSVADGAALSKNQLQYALICIKIASTTITRSEAMMKKRLMCSASWISIYTIFLSVICLIFLIAAHTGTATPGEAWKKAETGIKLLAHCRCREGCATACLDVLKKLVSELSHTVDFDFDAIESSVSRLCQHHDNAGDESTTHTTDNTISTENQQNSVTTFSGRLSDILNPGAAFVSTERWRAGSATREGSETEPFRQTASQWDADEILAQAQEMSLGDATDEFINLDP